MTAASPPRHFWEIHLFQVKLVSMESLISINVNEAKQPGVLGRGSVKVTFLPLQVLGQTSDTYYPSPRSLCH